MERERVSERKGERKGERERERKEGGREGEGDLYVRWFAYSVSANFLIGCSS